MMNNIPTYFLMALAAASLGSAMEFAHSGHHFGGHPHQHPMHGSHGTYHPAHQAGHQNYYEQSPAYNDAYSHQDYQQDPYEQSPAYNDAYSHQNHFHEQDHYEQFPAHQEHYPQESFGDLDAPEYQQMSYDGEDVDGDGDYDVFDIIAMHDEATEKINEHFDALEEKAEQEAQREEQALGQEFDEFMHNTGGHLTHRDAVQVANALEAVSAKLEHKLHQIHAEEEQVLHEADQLFAEALEHLAGSHHN